MNLFAKNPEKKLRKQYEQKMKEVMEAQRAGDIVRSSELSVEAERLLQEISACSERQTMR